MSKDYYKILGVAEFDTTENIKKAYRHLARKWHPDIAGNTPDVMAKFKEINEAYEILSNSLKKEEYDKARRFYNYARSEESLKQNFSKEATNPHRETEKNFSFKDFFTKTFSNEQTTKEIKSPRKGNDIYSDIEINAYESITGVVKIINLLQTKICPICRGRKFINGSVCNHCNGSGEVSNYKKFTVRIPSGIADKSKIRLSGEGEIGINGGSNGDLYLTVHVKNTGSIRLDGVNVLKEVSITPYEAVLGTKLEISGLDGKVQIKIPPRTQSGQKFRLTGCGVVQNNKVGDMIITVEIKIPKKLSEEEILLYRKLEEISNSSVRDTNYE